MKLANIIRSFTFARLRYQIIGGLLVAVLLPIAARYGFLGPNEDTYPLYTTALGSVAAFVLGAWILRNITTYPGVETISYVVTAISTSYSLLFIILIMARLPYNRAALIASWILSALWFVAVYAKLQRYRSLRIGVVPPCDPRSLEAIEGVESVTLTSPDIGALKVDAIVADLRSDIPAKWDAALADYALAGIPVYHVKHLLESLTGRVELEHLSENSFGSLAPLSTFMVFKQVVDWLIALIAGVLLIPLFIIVGIGIKATSVGPILFRQQRIGYQGKPFTVYKFRTMFVDADATQARYAAMTRDGDARITSIGRFLRRSRVDELPQVINILKGEMSWIGPRPEAEVLSRWYQEEIPFYRYRHIVYPGLTGWAQVSQGHVTDINAVREKLNYDFYYIKNFSMWLDLLIVNKTIATVVSGFGAK